MKVLRFHGREDVRVEDIPLPTPGPGEVLIRNAYAGICGSDLHLYFAPESVGTDLTVPHPLTKAKLPQILGHEFSGTVAQLGEGVSTVEVGARVAIWPVYACGECAQCSQGAYNRCSIIAFDGLTAAGGGMAEFTVVPATKLHVLPETVDLKLGALVEPMSVAWRAVTRSEVRAGHTALIAGAGPIGIGTWLALRARGVTKVLVSEPSESRRAAIEALGARTVDPITSSLDDAVHALSAGKGVDVAFDAAGVGPAVAGLINSLKPGGRLVFVAMHERPVELSAWTIATRELEVVGALAYLPEEFDAVIEAMSRGMYDASGWVEVVAYTDVADVMAELRSGRRMKVLVSAAA